MSNPLLNSLKIAGIFLLTHYLSCVQISENENASSISYLYKLDSASFEKQLRQVIESFDSIAVIDIEGVPVIISSFIRELYERNSYLPYWHEKEAYRTYLKNLKEIHLDGLIREDYNYMQLQHLFQQINSLDTTNHKLVAAFDLITTNSLLLFSLHLAKGKSDPVKLDPNWNYDFLKSNPGEVDTIYRYLSQGAFDQLFHAIRSRSEFYLGMRNTMIDLYEAKAANAWDSIDFEGINKIELGDSNQVVVAIKNRLNGLTKNAGNPIYDSSTIALVMDFQELHGLESDGVIGKGTMDALNYSIDYKINKVKANMERARWLVSDLDEKLLVVNIADFNAYLMQRDSILFSSKIMVGKTYTKTPIFQSVLSYAEINPTWTVPRSILNRSILPKLRKDRNYLAKSNMKLLNFDGSQASIDGVDLNSTSFPYVVRQEPGPKNALGLVKFIFPNDFSVYLHDTNSRYLFARNKRTFSSGCVRLDQPLEWTRILLNDPKYDESAINELIESGKTKRLYPKEKIRIMILYFTHVTERKTGKPFYYKDVYNRDERILKVLNAPIDTQALINRVQQLKKSRNAI
ncbi:MAG: L,D-transpeptidase family protein [Bacteroidota bacterium]